MERTIADWAKCETSIHISLWEKAHVTEVERNIGCQMCVENCLGSSLNPSRMNRERDTPSQSHAPYASVPSLPAVVPHLAYTHVCVSLDRRHQHKPRWIIRIRPSDTYSHRSSVEVNDGFLWLSVIVGCTITRQMLYRLYLLTDNTEAEGTGKDGWWMGSMWRWRVRRCGEHDHVTYAKAQIP